MAEIVDVIAKGNKGFDSWQRVMSHLNYGLQRHLAVMYNSGQDVTLTPTQRKIAKSYAMIVQLGGMKLEDAINFCRAQGIENPDEVLDNFLSGADEEEEIDEVEDDNGK
jgi:hypothetical protein